MSASNPWIKQTRYFCKACSSWMDNNPRAIRVHESGKKHIDNAEKQRIAARDEHKKQEKEKERMNQMMVEIERRAAAKYAEDIGQPVAVTTRVGHTSHTITEERGSVAAESLLMQSSHVPVPVASGCYCGADGVYYYYDATTQQYSVADTQWAQTQIATYGPLQFTPPSSTAASTDLDVAAVAAEAHARNLSAVDETTQPSSSSLSTLPATRAPVTAALGLALPRNGKVPPGIRAPPGVKRKVMDSSIEIDTASTSDIGTTIISPTSSTVLSATTTSDDSLPAAFTENSVVPAADVVGEWEEVIEKPEEVVTREAHSISRTNFGGSSLVVGSKTRIAVDVQASTIPTVNNSEDNSEEEFVFKKKKKIF